MGLRWLETLESMLGASRQTLVHQLPPRVPSGRSWGHERNLSEFNACKADENDFTCFRFSSLDCRGKGKRFGNTAVGHSRQLPTAECRETHICASSSLSPRAPCFHQEPEALQVGTTCNICDCLGRPCVSAVAYEDEIHGESSP